MPATKQAHGARRRYTRKDHPPGNLWGIGRAVLEGIGAYIGAEGLKALTDEKARLAGALMRIANGEPDPVGIAKRALDHGHEPGCLGAQVHLP